MSPQSLYKLSPKKEIIHIVSPTQPQMIDKRKQLSQSQRNPTGLAPSFCQSFVICVWLPTYHYAYFPTVKRSLYFSNPNLYSCHCSSGLLSSLNLCHLTFSVLTYKCVHKSLVESWISLYIGLSSIDHMFLERRNQVFCFVSCLFLLCSVLTWMHLELMEAIKNND